ncbi:MAG: hypothetical protein QOJ84_2636 [Bradyrhizobium sp.]|nr:hypothetical protein [Bradyrhizobium sp.]
MLCERFEDAARVKRTSPECLPVSAFDPGCVKTPSFNFRVEHLSQFHRWRNRLHWLLLSGDAIEKTILRVLGSRTFSHSLDQERTLNPGLIELAYRVVLVRTTFDIGIDVLGSSVRFCSEPVPLPIRNYRFVPDRLLGLRRWFRPHSCRTCKFRLCCVWSVRLHGSGGGGSREQSNSHERRNRSMLRHRNLHSFITVEMVRSNREVRM